MRRLVAVLAISVVVLSACGGTASSTGAASTSPPSAATTPPPGSTSMPEHPMTESSMPLGAGTSDQEITGAAMSDGAGMSSGAGTTAAPSSVAAATGSVIATAGSDFGEVLFDGTGQAIYLFDKETSTKPDCYDECAVAWPPVLTVGPPVAGPGVDAAALGTSARTDGTVQVTYGGHPLYFYAHEGKNQVTCHNVSEFGGLWLVVTPSGRAAS